MKYFYRFFFFIFPLFLFANDLIRDDLGRIISGKNDNTQFDRIYDENNNLIYEGWSNGLSLNKIYGSDNELLQIQFPNGKTLFIGQDYLEYEGHIRRTLKKNTLGQILIEECGLDKAIEYHFGDEGILQEIQGPGIDISFHEKELLEIHGDESKINDFGQIEQCKDIVCKYDSLGRLIRKTSPKRTINFTYDEHSQLILVQYDDISIVNTYDTLGRKIEKEIWQNGKKIDHEYFLYDGIFEIASFNESKELKELRILDPKNPLRTVFLEQKCIISYPICSQHGHTVALIYPDRSLEVINDFPLFGEEPEKLLHPWAYSGHRFDPEIGQYYFGKRHYDPELISWTTPDPLGQTTNPYCYLFGDPNHYVDLDGQWAVLIPILESILEVTAEIANAVAGAEAVRESVQTFNEVAKKVETKEEKKNTNPFDDPVDEDVIVVDPEGNAIKVSEGNWLTGSKDGKWVQERTSDGTTKGKETGTRKDDGHKPSQQHTDHRSLEPHGHVPGVMNPDGTPWLPIHK